MNLRFCFLIPCYRHTQFLAGVLQQLSHFQIPCILIDDGNSIEEKTILEQLAQQFPGTHLLRLEQNQGKGAALCYGFQVAYDQGYSHAIQVDADGQHDLTKVPEFLQQATLYPHALISGKPVYDASVPKKRLYGRYATHTWVWVETLSFCIKDSMCGFRVYPLASVHRLRNNQVSFGRRMDFDTDIMVKLYWEKVPVRFIDVPVIYPENGYSNFAMLADNVRITLMHTKLVCQMPYKMVRRCFLNPPEHWTETKEGGSSLGMRFLLWLFKKFGYRIGRISLWPVVLFFWLFSSGQRRASQQFLARVQTMELQQRKPKRHRSSLKHFYTFALSMLDKLASWSGHSPKFESIRFVDHAEAELTATPQQGSLLLLSHLGNIEVFRAIVHQRKNLIINALVFHANSQKFVQLMKSLDPDVSLNLIQVNEIGPDTAIMLKEKIDQGEWVAIMADRTLADALETGKARSSSFLGHAANFPIGPYVLASVLQCPVKIMFGIKEKNHCVIHCEPFAERIHLPRHARNEHLQIYIDQYCRSLETMALQYPLHWANFYDFWQNPLPLSQSSP